MRVLGKLEVTTDDHVGLLNADLLDGYSSEEFFKLSKGQDVGNPSGVSEPGPDTESAMLYARPGSGVLSAPSPGLFLEDLTQIGQEKAYSSYGLVAFANDFYITSVAPCGICTRDMRNNAPLYIEGRGHIGDDSPTKILSYGRAFMMQGDVPDSAKSALSLETPVTINGVLFDGTENITIEAPSSDIFEWAKASLKPTYTADEVGALAVDGTANAALSANKLTTAVNINGVSFDGTGDITITANAADVYEWAKASLKPTYTADEVGALAVDGTANAALSANKLTTAVNINGVSFDGTGDITITANAADVYEWAKASLKPTYTADEVGALAVDGTAEAAKKLLNSLTINGYVYDGSAAVVVDITPESIGAIAIGGNAGSADTALVAGKVSNALTFNGVNYDGSSPITIDVTAESLGGLSATGTAVSASKVANALTINDTTYDGSAAVTISITAESLGALTSIGEVALASEASKVSNSLDMYGYTYDGSSPVSVIITPTDIGALAVGGKAASATVADKVVGTLTIGTSTYNGSVDVSINPASIGALSTDGKAASATVADKVGSALTIGGYTYDGSSPVSVSITPAGIGALATTGKAASATTADKVVGTLTIGTSTYNGSVDVSINPTSIGALSTDGKAASATVADKVGSALTIGGYTYDGSSPVSVSITPAGIGALATTGKAASATTADKVGGLLTIGRFTYDGSAAVTVNITPADIGALAVGGIAESASKLANAVTINGVTFDGTSDITLTSAAATQLIDTSEVYSSAAAAFTDSPLPSRTVKRGNDLTDLVVGGAAIGGWLFIETFKSKVGAAFFGAQYIHTGSGGQNAGKLYRRGIGGSGPTFGPWEEILTTASTSTTSTVTNTVTSSSTSAFSTSAGSAATATSAGILSPGRKIAGVLFDGSKDILLTPAGIGALAVTGKAADALSADKVKHALTIGSQVYDGSSAVTVSFSGGTATATTQYGFTVNGTTFNNTANTSVTITPASISALAVTGKAASATSADKVKFPLTIGSQVYDGSAAVTVSFSGGTATATTQYGFTVNGTTFNNTANTSVTITPASISALAVTGKAASATSADKVKFPLTIGSQVYDGSAAVTVSLSGGTATATTQYKFTVNNTVFNNTANASVTITPTSIGALPVAGKAASASTADKATSALSADKVAHALTINGVAYDGSADVDIDLAPAGASSSGSTSSGASYSFTVNGVKFNNTANVSTKITPSSIGALSVNSIPDECVTAEKVKSFLKVVLGTNKVTSFYNGSDRVELTITPDTIGALGADATASSAEKLNHSLFIAGKKFDGSENISISSSDLGILGKQDKAASASVADKVANSLTINGKTAFDGSSDVFLNLTASDIGALSSTSLAGKATIAERVQFSLTINGKAAFDGSSKVSFSLSASDVGALATTGTAVSATIAKKLENSLTINNVVFDGSKDKTVNITADSINALGDTAKAASSKVADKVSHSLTINGTSYDGSKAISIDTSSPSTSATNKISTLSNALKIILPTSSFSFTGISATTVSLDADAVGALGVNDKAASSKVADKVGDALRIKKGASVVLFDGSSSQEVSVDTIGALGENDKAASAAVSDKVSHTLTINKGADVSVFDGSRDVVVDVGASTASLAGKLIITNDSHTPFSGSAYTALSFTGATDVYLNLSAGLVGAVKATSSGSAAVADKANKVANPLIIYHGDSSEGLGAATLGTFDGASKTSIYIPKKLSGTLTIKDSANTLLASFDGSTSKTVTLPSSGTVNLTIGGTSYELNDNVSLDIPGATIKVGAGTSKTFSSKLTGVLTIKSSASDANPIIFDGSSNKTILLSSGSGAASAPSLVINGVTCTVDATLNLTIPGATVDQGGVKATSSESNVSNLFITEPASGVQSTTSAAFKEIVSGACVVIKSTMPATGTSSAVSGYQVVIKDGTSGVQQFYSDKTLGGRPRMWFGTSQESGATTAQTWREVITSDGGGLVVNGRPVVGYVVVTIAGKDYELAVTKFPA